MTVSIGIIPSNGYRHRRNLASLLKAFEVIFHFFVVSEILLHLTIVINGDQLSFAVLCLDVPLEVHYGNGLVKKSSQ